jgi:hypothetical protein
MKGISLIKLVKKGFYFFSLFSLLLYGTIIAITKQSAEYLGMKDLFHVIPMMFFNEAIESIIAPSFPDIFFLIPIAISDGIIGAFIGLLYAVFFPNIKDKKVDFFILITSFILFQYVIFYLVPPFMP